MDPRKTMSRAGSASLRSSTSHRATPSGAEEAPSGARERLLDAAERLFGEKGFRATSVRDITSAAGCNVAAVNYHFKGKEPLYREVFHRRLRALREARVAGAERALHEAGDRAGLETLLRAFTTAFLEPHVDRSGGRRLMQLFSRELLDPHLRPGTFQSQMIGPVQEALTRAIRKLCPGIEARAARRCATSLMAQLVHVVQLRQLPGGSRGAGEPGLEEYADHIVRFTAAGIRGFVE
jgi:AcrR family transcriptional regulator